MENLLPSDLERCVSRVFAGLREERRLTQEELAGRARLCASIVAKIESGTRRVHLDELPGLCAALGVGMHAVVDRFFEEMRRAARANGGPSRSPPSRTSRKPL